MTAESMSPIGQAVAGPLRAVPEARNSGDRALLSTTLASAHDQLREASVSDGALLEKLVGLAASLANALASAAVFENGLLVCRATTAGMLWMQLGCVVQLEGTICGEAIDTRRIIRSGTPSLAAGEHKHLVSSCCPNARSHMVLPLLAGDETLGLLCLASEEQDWFNAEDEGSVANLAAVAARLLSGMPIPSEGVLPPVVGGKSDYAALHGLGMWSWDSATNLTSCSPSVAELFGLESEAHITMAMFRELLHPEDLPRFEAILAEQLEGGTGVAGTLRIRSPFGERHVHAWGEVRRNAAGQAVGAWGAAVDVTEREQEAAALRASLAGLRAAKKLTGLGLWEWHPKAGELKWSDEMYRFVGLEPGAVRPSLELWHRAIHPDDRDLAADVDLRSLDSDGGGAVATFRVVGFDQVVRHVQSWSTLISADDGSPLVVAGATVDITRQVNDRAELDRTSITDPVTGLANRLGFERWVKNLLDDATQNVALLLLDLDRFKMVNDSLGHPVGDRLLVEVARRLERVAPLGSLTARMGGDEFVIVPPVGMTSDELREIAQTVIDALREPLALNGTGEVLFCPASIGLTSSAGRHVDLKVLLAEADLALYRAKDDGRDRFAIFDDALREKVKGRRRAEQLLRSALAENRLVLQYQPIRDFRNGRVVGAEALVRMLAQDNEILLTPEHFIDVAEDIGLVIELDCWVVRAALDQLAIWSRAVPPRQVPWLAINVSPRSMEHPRIVRALLDGVRERGLPPNLIKVELTESSFLSSLPGGERALHTLISNGIPVGIDDFGTGYSALAHLTRFDLAFMKIDRSFVARVGQDTRADAVVEAIVKLAHAHLMKVTAEGVETSIQAQRLREMNCDYAQGFYIGRPGPAHRILPGQP